MMASVNTSRVLLAISATVIRRIDNPQYPATIHHIYDSFPRISFKHNSGLSEDLILRRGSRSDISLWLAIAVHIVLAEVYVSHGILVDGMNR